MAGSSNVNASSTRTVVPGRAQAQAQAQEKPLPADPFSTLPVYQDAVKVSISNLAIARQKSQAAHANQDAVDSATNAELNRAQATRDTNNAEASKPVAQAMAALAAKRKELQAPIDSLTQQLAAAQAELDRTTFPDKQELDAARADAHAKVERLSGLLNQAQTNLARFDAEVADLQNQFASYGASRNAMIADLSNTNAQLQDADLELRRAQSAAPSDSQIQDASTQRQAAHARYDAAVAALGDYDAKVKAAAEATANGPAPASTNGPTPPAPGGTMRPKPPASTDRPAPPPVANPYATKPASTDRPAPPPVANPYTTRPATNDRPTPPSVNGPTPPVPNPYARPTGGNRPTPPSGNNPPTPSSSNDHARAELEGKITSARNNMENLDRHYDKVQGKVDELNRRRATYDQLSQRSADISTQLNSVTATLQGLASTVTERSMQRPGLIDQVSTGQQMLAEAQGDAQRLDNTPYRKGDPAAIAAGQAKVDGLASNLAGARKAYTNGTKPYESALASAQATYATTMAPFDKAIQEASTKRETQLGQARQTSSAADGHLQDDKKAAEHLRDDVPLLRRAKWDRPRWLGGDGFDLGKFWKGQPSVD